MARFIRRAAASLGIGLVLWSFAAPALAVENETFGLSPFPERINNVVRRTFAVPLDRGSRFEDAVRVYNRTDQQIELLVYPADARAALDGTISVGLRGSAPTGVGSWIHLDRRTLTLAPHGSSVIRFRITVGTAKPSPDLGAIVAENAVATSRPGVSRRLDIVVRTTPPGSPTLSTKVRAFSLRSGWTIVALGVLVAAGALVWLARRRARRSREVLEPSTVPEKTDTDAPEASRPVLHRFGRADTDPKLDALDKPELLRRRPPRRRPVESDERPLLDEVAFVDDEELEEELTDEVELPPARKTARKPAPKKPSQPKSTPQKKTPPSGDKLNYIPLDDL